VAGVSEAGVDLMFASLAVESIATFARELMEALQVTCAFVLAREAVADVTLGQDRR
jgi:hypothetical protein